MGWHSADLHVNPFDEATQVGSLTVRFPLTGGLDRMYRGI